jgi:hypothetical protein
MGIEAALLGSALASSTAGASAVGLLGAGGVFAPMAGSIATGLGGLGSILSIGSGISSIFGGLQASQAGAEQAAFAKTQAMQQAAESTRVARKEAGIVAEDADRTRRAQKLGFMKSGVSLEGSPLLLMEQTRMKGAENVDEIIRAGASGKVAAIQEGRIKAQQYRSGGRQGFISGLTGAGSAFANVLRS